MRNSTSQTFAVLRAPATALFFLIIGFPGLDTALPCSPPPSYILTTSVTGQGSVSPSGGTYAAGTVLSLTATPSTGWVFSNWQGALSGSTNPASLTMNSNKSVTAVFVQENYDLTLSVNNLEAGTASASPSPGPEGYSSGTVVTLTASANAGWVFDHWEGNLTGSTNPDTITMDADKVVTAVFLPQFTLTTTVQGSGSITLAPPGGTYAQGTQVTLTAVPEIGWAFDHWEGAATGTSEVTAVTMNSNQSVTAVFVERYYTLSLSVNDPARGSVTPTPSPGPQGYPASTTVTLTATANSGFTFSHWTGDLGTSANPETILMNANKAVTAVFVPSSYTLTVETWREGSVAPEGGSYTPGTVVQVTATPQAGVTRFDHWEGDVPEGQEYNATINVTVDADKELLAVFVRQMALGTGVIGEGSVTPTDGIYDQDSEVVVTATPASGWAFLRWLGDAHSVDNPVTVLVDAPMTVIAEFVSIEHATGLDLAADLGELLVATGDLTVATDVLNLEFDRGGDGATEGNGIPDAAEFMLLQAILERPAFNRSYFGGASHRTIYGYWSHNLAQAATDLPGAEPEIRRAIAAYLTLGTDGHEAWAVSAADAVASVTLDASEYQRARGRMSLGHLGDADGDATWNRLEWVSVLDHYEVTTPSMTEAAIYVEWALDPTLPAQVDIGLDLPDGDGTGWDYSHLPQGTVTFESAQGLPIEVRILDPPGREDVPVALGVPVQIPLGAEVLIKLVPSTDGDWFYTWSAPGNMIQGGAEKAERFRLMCSSTIKPLRRPTYDLPFYSPPGGTGYTLEWSGVGPFGHLIESGSGSGAVAVPKNAALRLRAYKLEEAPAGGSYGAYGLEGAGAGMSSGGDDKIYCQRWKLYDNNYGGDYYVFGSSPAFGNFDIGYSITPEFGSVYAPHGWVTHSAKCDEGGTAYIAATSPAWWGHIEPVLYGSATVPAPDPESQGLYYITTQFIAEPGYELAAAEWDGNGPPGPYSGETGSRTVNAKYEMMGELQVEVRVDGGGGTPAEAGHVTGDEADKYYPLLSTKYVQLSANAHNGFYFTHWSGGGVAYPDDGDDEPDLGNEMPLDDSETPVTENPIWIAMGAGGGTDREVAAHMNQTEVEIVLTWDDGPKGYHKYVRYDDPSKSNPYINPSSGEYTYITYDEEGNPTEHATDIAPRTRSILDALEDEGAKAAFFVQVHENTWSPHGGGTSQGAKLIQEMSSKGHLVGIHTAGAMQHIPAHKHPIRANSSDKYPVGDNGEVGMGSIPEDALNLLDCDLEAGKRRLAFLGASSQYVRATYGEGFSVQVVQDTYSRRGLEHIFWDAEYDPDANYETTIPAAIRGAQASGMKSIKIVVLLHDHNTSLGSLWGPNSAFRKIEQVIAGAGGKLKGFELP